MCVCVCVPFGCARYTAGSAVGTHRVIHVRRVGQLCEPGPYRSGRAPCHVEHLRGWGVQQADRVRVPGQDLADEARHHVRESLLPARPVHPGRRLDPHLPV